MVAQVGTHNEIGIFYSTPTHIYTTHDDDVRMNGTSLLDGKQASQENEFACNSLKEPEHEASFTANKKEK
jgi:hypothetical protein